MTNFCVINCEETVWYIFYLFKGFLSSTYLTEISVVNVEITLLGVFKFVANTKLTEEEGLPLVAFIHARA